MTGDINDLFRTDFAQQVQALSRTTRAGRIKDYNRLLRGEALDQKRQLLLCSSNNEIAVLDAAGKLISARSLHRQFIGFDAGKRIHQIGQFQSKETYTAKNVDQ